MIRLISTTLVLCTRNILVLLLYILSCSLQFKAKPFNPKIVTLKGRLGVPVIEKRLLTRPVPPVLTLESKPKHSEEELVKREEFRARPLPKDILEGVKVRIIVDNKTYIQHLTTFRIL